MKKNHTASSVSSPTQKTLVHLGIILFLTTLAFINIFPNGFIHDDFNYIVNWPLIQDWKNWPQFFVGYIPPKGEEGVFSPLKTLFHAIAWHLFHAQPIGHHALAIFIHLAAVFFAYRVFELLTENAFITFIATLLFALHPIHVEYVTSMTGSIDNMGDVFLFASFYQYIKAHKFPASTRHYIQSLILALLAMYTHELVLSLPILFLWYDLCYARDRNNVKALASRVYPFFLIAISYVLCKYLTLGAVARGRYLYDNFYLTMLVEIKAFAQYVLLMLFPFDLSHNHVISPGIFAFGEGDFDKYAVLSQSIFDGQVLASLVLLGTILYYAWRMFQRDVLVTFCIGWFFLSLAPVTGIIPNSVYFAERYLYPGSLTFSLLMAYYFNKWRLMNPKQAKLVTAVIVVIVVAYTGRIWLRNRDALNEVTMFESVVRSNPYSANMRNDLGLIYTRYKLYDKALESFNQSLRIRPQNAVPYFGMAEVYMQVESYTLAMESLKKAIELNPEYAEAYYNLAGLYGYMGLVDEAKKNLDTSVFYYQKQGRQKEADENARAFKDYFGFN